MKRESKKLEFSDSKDEYCWDQNGLSVVKPHFESAVPWPDGMSELEAINAAAGPLIVGSSYVPRVAKDNDPMIGILIRVKLKLHRETGNTVYLLEAFLLSHELGVYPPAAVLNWLAEAFSDFHRENAVDDHGNSLNLSKMLGLAPGKGQENVFQPLLRNELYDRLMLDMAHLKIHFGLSASDAALLVEARLRETVGWNKSKFEIKAPYAAELVKRYSKVRAMYEQLITEYQVAPMSNEDLCQLINQYPKSAILELPPKARQKLKNYLK